MIFILTILLFFLFLSHLKLRDRVDVLESKTVNKQENISKVKNEVIATVDDVEEEEKMAKSMKVANFNQNSGYEIREKEISKMEESHLDIPRPDTNFSPATHQKEKEKDFFLVRWFVEHTLIKIGSIILFLGTIYLVSFAVTSKLISPFILILIGFLLGVVSYAVAVLRSTVSKTQYVTLTALGTGIVSASLFAADAILPTFTSWLMLLLLALSFSYTAYVAWQAKTTWLATATGGAGLLVPLLFEATSEPIWTMFYLLVLMVGVLLVSYKLELRPVTLLMVLGVGFYQLALFGEMSSYLLWVFVIISSVVSLGAVTLSFVKTKKPHTLDVMSMASAGILFIVFASEIALSAGLATFTATVILSCLAYWFTIKEFPLSVVSVYVGFAVVGLLLSTSFTFSGYTEALAYTIEISAVFFLATYLGLPFSVIRLIALAYFVPVFASFEHFSSRAWQEGVLHADGLVLYAVALSLIGGSLWLIHKKSVNVYSWSKPLAEILGTVGFVYAMAVVARVTYSVFSGDATWVMMYVAWGLMSLLLVYYAVRVSLSCRTLSVSVASTIIPLFVSFGSLSSSAWYSGVSHVHGFGVLAMFIISVLIVLLLTWTYRAKYSQSLRRVLGISLVVTILYLFVGLGSVFNRLFEEDFSLVAIYTSYMFILYGLISFLATFKANINWLKWSLLALIWPLLISLSSFDFSGWSKDEIVNPAGLFTVMVLLVLIAIRVRYCYREVEDEKQKLIFSWTKTLFITTFVFTVGYLWSVSHSLLADDKAVTLSLFVYTIVGLSLYLYGSKDGKSDWRYGGVALLVFVVFRLILVDVWEMELLWRVVTFLGIGILFIVTALFEKQNSKVEIQNENENG